MEEKISLTEKDNCITIELEGTPTYLKIYDENKSLKRIYNRVSKKHTFFTTPGEYIVESDGKISKVYIKKVDKSTLFANKIKIRRGAQTNKIRVYFAERLMESDEIKDLVKKERISLKDLNKSIVNYFNKQFMFFLGKSNLSESMKSIIITEIEKQTGIKVKKDLDEFVEEWMEVEKNILSTKSVDKLFDILEKFAN